jgi:tetratricopeptide (TPR) repeat protein
MDYKLTPNPIGALFGLLRSLLMRTQWGRWVLGALFLVMALACAALAVAAPDTTQRLGFAIGAGFFLLLALMLLIGNGRIAGARRRVVSSAAAEGQALAKQLLAEGKLLPIPPLPANPPQGATQADLAQVEQYAKQLSEIPWGNQVAYPVEQARALFEQALSEVNTASGDWSKLSGPISVFAGLPRPLCHVGAAEAMFRLSYLRGTTYAPVGLRQGLRFAVYAQVREPLQPDALIAQLKLFSACRAPTWQDLATKTLAHIQRVAPEHPRLPLVEMFYHRMRGEYEQALECADRALWGARIPGEAAALLSSKALLLMSLKRNEEAVDTFQAAISRNPDDPWIWHNMSLANTALGRYHEALRDSERALSLMEFGAARKQHDLILQKLG